jgi:hypothetical protein
MQAISNSGDYSLLKQLEEYWGSISQGYPSEDIPLGYSLGGKQISK